MQRVIAGDEPPPRRVPDFATLAAEVRHYLDFPALGRPPEPTHVLALFSQICRAFHFTIEHILGGSLPAARLRAAVWQAIFTRDMRRYRRALYERMHDVTTLIVGPSGTGKELVARAIALSRYIPFDARAERFAEDFREAFCPLNISALPSALVESELFGHKKGAFTGAVADRQGWLETCPPFGTVFLDEVAEIDAAIQVKLLRVLQERSFQRLGRHGRAPFRRQDRRRHQPRPPRRDAGRPLPRRPLLPPLLGHHRDPAARRPAPQRPGRARPPPALPRPPRRRRGRGRGRGPGDGELDHGAPGRGLPWPGNVRELEQCVRNVMVRGEYRPPRPAPHGVREELASAFLGGALTVDAMLRRYCTLVFAQTRSYDGAARRLGIDRRTMKEKVDPALLEQLTGGDGRRHARSTDPG
jgi:hypothetical protein